jgi:glycosyltransferase involved in cell wall biosynthesis
MIPNNVLSVAEENAPASDHPSTLGVAPGGFRRNATGAAHDPLHILIDGRMISNTGIGRWLENIVSHLGQVDAHHRLTVLVNPDSQSVRGFSAPTRKMRFPSPIYSLREQVALPFEVSAVRPDVTHYPNFNVPLADWTPAVVTLCDIIYYLFPKACPSWIGYQYARFMIRAAAQKARKVVTISEYSKSDLVNHLGIDENKVAVIYPAIDRNVFKPQQTEGTIAAVKRKFGIERPYIFYTGNHEPRKNLATLVRAYRRLRGQKDLQLVIGGPIDPRRQDLYREMADLVADQHVMLCGSLDEADLPVMYAGADLFVFPSKYEGFGLPPLEALACGVPVACSSATSLPEVVGDAALMFAPENTDELVAVMEAILGSPTLAADLRGKALVRAGDFSWDTAARQLIQIYREVSSHLF